MKTMKRIFLCVFLLVLAAGGFGVWVLLGSKTSNPHNYATIGDIPTPWGYERVDGEDAAYARFLRQLPLKRKGAKVMLYTGGVSRFQSLNYAVVDVPLLSNAEQCADVCMRLRAEYLYHTGQYGRIRFQNVIRALSEKSLWRGEHVLAEPGDEDATTGRHAAWRCVCLSCPLWSEVRTRRDGGGCGGEQTRQEGVPLGRRQYASEKYSCAAQLRESHSLAVVHARRGCREPAPCRVPL